MNTRPALLLPAARVERANRHRYEDEDTHAATAVKMKSTLNAPGVA